jgi:hypothetical protein
MGLNVPHFRRASDLAGRNAVLGAKCQDGGFSRHSSWIREVIDPQSVVSKIHPFGPLGRFLASARFYFASYLSISTVGTEMTLRKSWSNLSK